MLRQLRIFYHNNKTKVWLVVGIIIFVYVIIRLMDAQIRKNNEENILNNTENVSTVNSQTYLPSKDTAAISNTTVPKETLKQDTDIIKQFIDYCNKGDIDSAYSLLSTDCKEENYKTKEDFYNNYVNEIFTEEKSYDIETWSGALYNSVVYKVKYIDDIMATGKTSEEYIEEYIAVVSENNEKKLNINQFIQKDNINKKVEEKDLEVGIIAKYIYYDYEEYEMTFKNNNQYDSIIIDTKDDTESVYIEDKNGVKYTWFGNEIPNLYLTLQPGDTRTFRIKFNKVYATNKSDSNIYFTDVRINNEKTTLKVNVQ